MYKDIKQLKIEIHKIILNLYYTKSIELVWWGQLRLS